MLACIQKRLNGQLMREILLIKNNQMLKYLVLLDKISYTRCPQQNEILLLPQTYFVLQ